MLNTRSTCRIACSATKSDLSPVITINLLFFMEENKRWRNHAEISLGKICSFRFKICITSDARCLNDFLFNHYLSLLIYSCCFSDGWKMTSSRRTYRSAKSTGSAIKYASPKDWITFYRNYNHESTTSHNTNWLKTHRQVKVRRTSKSWYCLNFNFNH
jgi:hypothetical protein